VSDANKNELNDREIFKLIPSHPGYEVSNRGRVRKLAYIDADNKSRRPFLLSQFRRRAATKRVDSSRMSRGWYVMLCRHGSKVMIAVPSLVYDAFFGELDTSRYRLAFADGNPKNSRLENIYAEPRAAERGRALINKVHRLRTMVE